MKKQARFWVYHNGAARIKLRQDQTFHHVYGGATDEGYSWEFARYTFDGKQVTCEWSTDARDCDGRMTRHGVTVCRFGDLAAGHNEDGIAFPAWQQIDECQRDHTAEAAGY